MSAPGASFVQEIKQEIQSVTTKVGARIVWCHQEVARRGVACNIRAGRDPGISVAFPARTVHGPESRNSGPREEKSSISEKHYGRCRLTWRPACSPPARSLVQPAKRLHRCLGSRCRGPGKIASTPSRNSSPRESSSIPPRAAGPWDTTPTACSSTPR